MFSMRQKREIADEIQKILRKTNHPELPEEEIKFNIYIEGKEEWSFANIKNNASVTNPGINVWNELQDKEKRIIIE